MAHEIMNKDNMIYVGDKPWHGLGTQFITSPGVEEALIAAKLNWEVGLKPLYTLTEQGNVDEKAPAYATYRKDDNSVLGVVGERYKPYQNVDAFDYFKPFIEAGDATIETAGSLKNGRIVWILAKLNQEPIEVVKGDAIEKYLLLAHSHDGKLAIRNGFTPIRVVCNNTLSYAIGHDQSQLIRVRHTSNAKANLEELRDTINVKNAEFEASASEYYKLLANKSINSQDLQKYIKIVLGIKEDKDGKLSTKSLNNMNNVIRLFEVGQGNDMPGVAGTYWAAYNAVTEHLSHVKGRNADNRYNSLWFGQGAVTNKNALTTALTLVKAA